MGRDEEEQFEQDNRGNVRRKLDQFRAREGQVENSPTRGVVEITQSGNVGTARALLSQPAHADAMYVTEVWAFNSAPTQGDTFHIVEGDPDGAGGLNNEQRRSVDIQVNSAETRREPYAGQQFDRSIGFVTDFQGQIAVGVVTDHHESSEPDVEQ